MQGLEGGDEVFRLDGRCARRARSIDGKEGVTSALHKDKGK